MLTFNQSIAIIAYYHGLWLKCTNKYLGIFGNCLLTFECYVKPQRLFVLQRCLTTVTLVSHYIANSTRANRYRLLHNTIQQLASLVCTSLKLHPQSGRFKLVICTCFIVTSDILVDGGARQSTHFNNNSNTCLANKVHLTTMCA